MKRNNGGLLTPLEITVVVLTFLGALIGTVWGVRSGNYWDVARSVFFVAWLSLYLWINFKRPKSRSYFTSMTWLLLGVLLLLSFGEDRKLSDLGFFFLVAVVAWIEMKRKKTESRERNDVSEQI